MARNTTKSDSGAINRGGHNLLKCPKLLSNPRLEIEGELDLGNRRTHGFTVVSGLDDSGTAKLAATKDFWTEISPSDFTLGNVRERRPVLGLDKDLLVEPIRDGLLADGRPVHELGEALGQGRLAARDVDGAPERSNVRFLHDAGEYTNRFVAVNNPVCVTDHKSACIVLPMRRSTKRKNVSVQRRNVKIANSVRLARPGPDGKTLGQRIRIAMAHKSAVVGFEYTQAMLTRDVASRKKIPDDNGLQQTISAAMRTSNTCKYTPAIAAITGVSTEWLADGNGSMLET